MINHTKLKLNKHTKLTNTHNEQAHTAHNEQTQKAHNAYKDLMNAQSSQLPQNIHTEHKDSHNKNMSNECIYLQLTQRYSYQSLYIWCINSTLYDFTRYI